MEAFEAIRTAAAELHDELVTRGADPNHPLRLLDAAAEHLELDLEYLPLSDPAMKGAQAF